MPRKTPKPRKPGPNNLSTPKPRRAARPEPTGTAKTHPIQDGMRDRRYDRRPPKFPGRLGGR